MDNYSQKELHDLIKEMRDEIVTLREQNENLERERREREELEKRRQSYGVSL